MIYYLEHNGDQQVCYPSGLINESFQSEDTLAFERRILEGELVFTGDDFWRIYEVELDKELSKLPFTLYVEVNTSPFYEYPFSCSMVEFDIEHCTARLRAEVDDKYTPIFNGWKTKYNLYNYSDNNTITVTIDAVDYEWTRAKSFLGAIQWMLQQIVPTATVSSTFFTDATNYVTLKTNTLKYLKILQKSEVMSYGIAEPTEAATRWETTLWDMLEWLRILFNVYWDYDSGVMTLEHISYFKDLKIEKDIRGEKVNSGKLRYRWDIEKILEAEHFWQDDGAVAGGFKYARIGYYGAMVTKGDKNSVEYKVPISTDIEYLLSDLGKQEASSDGFVLFAPNIAGALIAEANYVNSASAYNNALSMANLVQFYHRHNRPLLYGFMNGRFVEFVTQKKVIIQEMIFENYCTMDYTPYKYLTELADERFSGQAGEPLLRKISLRARNVEMTLGYSEPDNVNDGMPFPEAYNFWGYLYDNGYATAALACADLEDDLLVAEEVEEEFSSLKLRFALSTDYVNDTATAKYYIGYQGESGNRKVFEITSAQVTDIIEC